MVKRGTQVMSELVRIDDLDRQILELLHVDARMPSSRVAECLDVTDRTVRNRIDKLLQSGLARIALLLNQEAAGYPIVGLIYIEVEVGRSEEVALSLVDQDLVNYVATNIGDWDIVVQVYARSSEELYDWVQTTIGKTEGVRRVRTNIHPRLYKRPADWFPASLRSGRGDDRDEAVGRARPRRVSRLNGLLPVGEGVPE